MEDERLRVRNLDELRQALCSAFTSMYGYREFRNTRNRRSTRTSRLDGCMSVRVVRLDTDPAGLDETPDRAVGEHHRGGS
jgi:hypothetical protein